MIYYFCDHMISSSYVTCDPLPTGWAQTYFSFSSYMIKGFFFQVIDKTLYVAEFSLEESNKDNDV